MGKRKDADRDQDLHAPVSDPASQPWVANYPPLARWLKAHNARCRWQVPRGEDRDRPIMFIESWDVEGPAGLRSFVLFVHANGLGWDIFTAGTSSKIDETLRDAEQRLELPEGLETLAAEARR